MFRNDKIARDISNDVLVKEIEILKQEKEVLQALLDNKKRAGNKSQWEMWPLGDVSGFWSRFTKSLKKHKSAILGAAVLGLIVGMVYFIEVVQVAGL
jgi:hypothetical protein